jgi:phosphatidylserine decarboxylase
MQEIRYFNREKNRIETERVYGEAALRWLYTSPAGKLLADWVLSRRLVSEAYGRLQSSRWSSAKVDRFVREFRIPMQDFEPGPFTSFNDFFIRRFRAGKRPFCQAQGDFPAPAEGRYYAFESVHPERKLPVKGEALSARALIADPEQARPFENGPVLLARLCPVDYHRYHYPDRGRTLASFQIPGRYHSVNPLALAHRGDIFITNERRVSLLDTANFGKLAFIEVGAICVGRIVQTHDESQAFERGQEKGYFLFGGSTVILLGEPGRWKPDADLLEQTAKNRETFVKIGTRVAAAPGTL